MTAIYGSSPWTRTAVRSLTPDELAAIEDILPDDMFVTVGSAARPGSWTIWLMQGDRCVATVRDCHYIPNGVRLAVLGMAEPDAEELHPSAEWNIAGSDR